MTKTFIIPAAIASLPLLLTAGAWLYVRTAMRGFSARADPARVERLLAAYARNTAMPTSAKTLKNPVHLLPDVQREAMTHSQIIVQFVMQT
jgi:hypothetical protein